MAWISRGWLPPLKRQKSWHVQAGNAVIPGSKDPVHIRADFELFDFELTDEEMKKIQVPVDEQK